MLRGIKHSRANFREQAVREALISHPAKTALLLGRTASKYAFDDHENDRRMMTRLWPIIYRIYAKRIV
jgi:hypothetical protein